MSYFNISWCHLWALSTPIYQRIYKTYYPIYQSILLFCISQHTDILDHFILLDTLHFIPSKSKKIQAQSVQVPGMYYTMHSALSVTGKANNPWEAAERFTYYGRKNFAERNFSCVHLSTIANKAFFLVIWVNVHHNIFHFIHWPLFLKQANIKLGHVVNWCKANAKIPSVNEPENCVLCSCDSSEFQEDVHWSSVVPSTECVATKAHNF